MNNSIFLEIMNSCGEKKIISRCKKLDKKNALTSGAVATTLAELAYWLYIYDHEEEALKVCEFSHIDMPKAYKVNYNVWNNCSYPGSAVNLACEELYFIGNNIHTNLVPWFVFYCIIRA